MTARYDVTTTGEAMIRLSVPPGVRLEVADKLDMLPGGAEANLTVALARMNRRAAWMGALPNSPLGRFLANHMRVAGVNLEGVAWSNTDRLGTYYVEFAAPPRATQVIYDRADSCAAKLTPEQVNWDLLLDTRLLHLTGITPPLSASSSAVMKEAFARARAANVPISFDVNYRQKLWSEQAAAEFIIPLVQGIDLFFCGRNDAKRVMGVTGEPENAVRRMAEMTQAKLVVMSLAEQGVIAFDGSQFYHEPAKPVQIIDRPGAGDALAAGIIHGWLDGDLPRGLKMGVVMAALALSQHGDMLVTTPEEVSALMATSDTLLVR
ncbi:MAG: sugar kinase [Caldilineaceae bacterium]|nr:sugar kinase [Caldilineaceae bacterium]